MDVSQVSRSLKPTKETQNNSLFITKPSYNMSGPEVAGATPVVDNIDPNTILTNIEVCFSICLDSPFCREALKLSVEGDT